MQINSYFTHACSESFKQPGQWRDSRPKVINELAGAIKYSAQHIFRHSHHGCRALLITAVPLHWGHMCYESRWKYKSWSNHSKNINIESWWHSPSYTFESVIALSLLSKQMDGALLSFELSCYPLQMIVDGVTLLWLCGLQNSRCQANESTWTVLLSYAPIKGLKPWWDSQCHYVPITIQISAQRDYTQSQVRGYQVVEAFKLSLILERKEAHKVQLTFGSSPCTDIQDHYVWRIVQAIHESPVTEWGSSFVKYLRCLPLPLCTPSKLSALFGSCRLPWPTDMNVLIRVPQALHYCICWRGKYRE